MSGKAVGGHHADRDSLSQSLAEVIRQVEALSRNQARSQALEQKLDQTCSNMRCELQGSMKLAMEAMKKKVADQLAEQVNNQLGEALNKKVMDQVKKNDDTCSAIQAEQRLAERRLKEYKLAISSLVKRLELTVGQPKEQEYRPGLTMGLDDGATQLTERLRRDNQHMQALRSRSPESPRSGQNMMHARTDSFIPDRKLPTLTEPSNEHIAMELADLKSTVGRMRDELLELSASAASQAWQEMQDHVDRSFSDLQKEVETAVKQASDAWRVELTDERSRASSLPTTELKSLKSVFKEHEKDVLNRFVAISGQIDALQVDLMTTSERDKPILQRELSQELNEQIGRQIEVLEQRLHGNLQKEFTNTVGQVKLFEQSMNQRLEADIGKIAAQLNQKLENQSACLDMRASNIQEKLCKDLAEIQVLYERGQHDVQILHQQSQTDVRAFQEEVQSDVTLLKDLVDSVKIDRIKEQINSINADQNRKHSQNLQALDALDSRLRDVIVSSSSDHNRKHTQIQQALDALDARVGALDAHDARARDVVASSNARVEQELSNLKSNMSGIRGELLDLTAAVTGQARKEIQDTLERQCGALQRDIENCLKQSNSAMKKALEAQKSYDDHYNLLTQLPAEMEAIKAMKKSFEAQEGLLLEKCNKVLAKLPGELDALKAGFAEQKDSVRNRMSSLSGQIDTVHTEMQRNLKDFTHKHWEVMHDMQEKLRTLNGGSLSRMQEQCDERVQTLFNSLQQKTMHALEDVKTDVDRYKSKVRDQFDQERTKREANEQRLLGKIDALSNGQDTLRKRSESRDRQCKAALDGGSFSWEDEVRRLWEALDKHTRDVDCEKQLLKSPPQAVSQHTSTTSSTRTSDADKHVPKLSARLSSMTSLTQDRTNSMSTQSLNTRLASDADQLTHNMSMQRRERSADSDQGFMQARERTNSSHIPISGPPPSTRATLPSQSSMSSLLSSRLQRQLSSPQYGLRNTLPG